MARGDQAPGPLGKLQGSMWGIANLPSKKGFNENAETLILLGMGDARLERAAFGSGDQRSIHLS